MKQVRIMELRGTYKGGGGPDKTILLSAARHDRDRFFVLVTYLRDPKDKEFQIGEMASQYGVPDYVEVSDRRMLDLKCLFQLNRLLRKNRLTIIHVHDLKTTLLGFLLKVLNPRVKILHTAHGWIVNSQFDSIKQKVQYAMLKSFPVHIAVSKATRDLMVKSGIKEKSIKVLYNSIDIDTWNKQNGKNNILRKELGIPDDCFLVGTIGRLSKEKDLPTFFRVAAEIYKNNKKVRFIIVGDGHTEDFVTELKSKARSMGISDIVFFTGHRTDLLNIYSDLNLFLMTSLTEGLPNTVLEAMAMEIPVVATRVGGVPEIVEDKKTGLLFECGDVEALTEGVETLISNPAMMKDFTETGRKQIVENFSFTARLAKIEKIYVELVQLGE